MDKVKQLQNKIEDLTGSKTFCVLPWIHLASRPNGDARLCCVANSSGVKTSDHIIGLIKGEDGTPSNFNRDLPLTVMNSEYIRSVRNIMLNGMIPQSCTKCFDEENTGVVSKRLWETATWSEELDIRELIKDTDVNRLYYLDLRLGNTCNLRCVMCSPHDSSSWIKEHKSLYPLFQDQELKQQMSWDKKTFNNVWYKNSDFWKEIYLQIPNLKQIYFAGGEPLMIQEHTNFLKEIIAQGYSKNISIRYNSNGLFLNEEIIEIWEEFKQVKFSLSMDGIYERLNYIRYPTLHDDVIKILERLDQTADNIQVNIACAVQILNIDHLPEFVKWKLAQGYKKINLGYAYENTQMGGGLINLHLVWIPTYFDVRILPKKHKKRITQKYQDFKIWLYENYTKDDDFWIHNPYGWKRYQALIDFMNSEDRSYLVNSLKEYIFLLDKNRNVDFKSIFLEFKDLF